MPFARRFAVLLVIGAACSTAGGAVDDIETLEHQIERTEPSERPAQLIALAERLEAVDAARGAAAAERALALARSPAERLAAQAALASLIRQQADYPGALKLAQEGLEAATTLGDDRLRASFLYVLARTYWAVGDYPTALRHFHDTIRLGEAVHDSGLLTDAHLGVVTLYREFLDLTQAKGHLEEARKFAELSRDPRRLGDYYRVLGNYLDAVGDLPGSRAAHERSRQINAEAGNERGVADALQNLGYVSESERKFDEAREQFVAAVAIYERLGLKRHLCNAYRQLGRVLVKQQRLEEGVRYLDASLELARGFGGRMGVAKAYKQLSIAHEVAGNLPLALDYQRRLTEENEAILGEQSRQQMSLLEARYGAERRRQQIELLERNQELSAAELQRARQLQLGLGALLLLGAVAVAAVVSRQRLKLAAERRVLAEARRAQQAADDANLLKTRLLGIVSHDLKAPLRGLVSGADEISRHPEKMGRNQALATRMHAEGERMFSLIRDLLDLSALETGGVELRRAPCDLGALAEARVALLRPAAEAKEQVLTIRLPGAPAIVLADASRLAQVIDNLISNALKFTPVGKGIHVSVECAGGRASLRVRDEGPGLAPEDFGRLFQPFQTLSAQPTAGESSSGLGLYIAHEMIALHGGQLGVESSPGEGAEFVFEVPLLADRSTADRAAVDGVPVTIEPAPAAPATRTLAPSG
ncbi:ATP-binding protein [Opitutus sp. ER46]|uniref:sensor histidine kinase n=1 Tax=Opitutus sp. ER46 TaxID=2161864 RepID=UPI000D318803|nr:ATP-binding protein [Opitutus sp. ER46]PTX91547.1 hypothetical protein DB354_16855 [Opitutus sp. ER46]